jgi:hypothetical protein
MLFFPSFASSYKGNGPATAFYADRGPSKSNSIGTYRGALVPEKRFIYDEETDLVAIREKRDGFNSGLPFDIFDFNNRFQRGSIIFKILPAPGAVEYQIRNISGSRTRASQQFDSVTGRRIESYPWANVAGIVVDLPYNSDDIILPYGSGGSFRGVTIVDRGANYINAGKGDDAVIGGYGQDFIGSRQRPQDLRQLANISAPTYFREPTTGTKLYVGGSSDDVLDGGSDRDLLVGDRLNGHELYLPDSALKDLPRIWAKQADQLSIYNDFGEDWAANGPGKGADLLAVRPTTRNFAAPEYYPLWIPGNDIIRGYEGDDIIHGDDNTISLNLYQLAEIRKWLANTPKEVLDAGGIGSSNWDKIKLGADFIDAGAGDDQIYAGVGADAVIGGTGADVIDTGPQILAPGFQPFYGPKVIYGDRATFDPITKSWTKDISAVSPDHFVIGGLFDTETELEQSKSGEFDALTLQRRTMSEALSEFEAKWGIAGKVLKNIPKVGKIITGIVDGVIKFMKFNDPKPVAPGAPAKASDSLTIIRDFDSVDILSINVPFRASLTASRNRFGVSGIEKENLLGMGLTGKRGTYLRLSKEAGTFYDRVFIEGDKELAILDISAPQENGSVTWTLGGSDYLDLLKNDGATPLYDALTI